MTTRPSRWGINKPFAWLDRKFDLCYEYGCPIQAFVYVHYRQTYRIRQVDILCAISAETRVSL